MSGRADAAMRLVRAAARSAGLGQRTDSELLTAFLDGDATAFEALVCRHGPMVLQACRQATRCEADAEDAFQAAFVQLYQQARSIRIHTSVAGWLFRVARRAAANARRQALRRDRREARAVVRADSLPTDLSWREACAILHEELDRLPDSYRLPLLLCYLQGQSRDEAARQLGLSLNEVRGRLERGRACLRGRLARRGVSLSAGLLAAMNAPALPAGIVPRALTAVRSTSPAAASALAWPGGIAVAVAAAVVLGVIIERGGAQAGPAPAAKPAAESPAAKGGTALKSATVSGRVINPDGKPVSGAKVFVQTASAQELGRPLALTDRSGKFTVPISDVEPNDRTAVIAVADGFVAAWRSWHGRAPVDVTIALANDDVPITGRILDLEGKPLAGATVTVDSVQVIPGEGPVAFLDWLSGRRGRPAQEVIDGAPPGATARTVTGPDGRFRLSGLGRDRIVHLFVSGPTIAHEGLFVVTAPAFDVAPKPRGATKIHPASFDHLAPPSRLIRGTVRDAETGKPIAGLRVNGYGGAAVVVTDAEGRYELPGYKKGPKYSIYARPADGSKYIPAVAEAADRAGLDPLVIDLKVQPGVPVSGRVTEPGGKAVAGSVTYYALAGNPNVFGIPVGEFYTQAVAIRPDGTFTCAALPGPGFLAVTAKGHYPAARVDPTGFFKAGVNPAPTKDTLYVTVGGAALSSVSQESFQAVVLLDVDKAKPPAEQKIELSPAEPVRGRLLAPDGQPLAEVRVRGLTTTGQDWSQPLPSAEFTATPPHSDRPRRLVFRHDGRKLAGTAVVAGGSKEPLEFKLEPWATLTGRLVDADGKPIARASIYAPIGRGKDARAVDRVLSGTVYTDADGRFKLDGLIPGVAYELSYREMRPKGRGGPVTNAASLKPGEVRELGELKVP
jgi:RNA polymerase sigma factor (sigma-70 family)